MAIDFPSSPTTNQQYTYNGVLYTYTSQGMWAAAGGVGATGPTGPTGAQGAAGSAGGIGPTGPQVYGSSRTWNPLDLSGVTLSNANLTATSTGNFQGVRAQDGFSSDKYYFEITATSVPSGFIGLAKSTIDLTAGTTTNAVGANSSGLIEVNNASTGISIGSIGTKIVGFAVDFSNSLIWMRAGAAGSWNATSGTANNPATGTGGVSISAIAGTLYPWFCAVFGGAGQNVTANFGASAFSGVVPSGFTPSWPGPALGPTGPAGSAATVHPHCGRLAYVSTTALSFKPYNGDRIKINGTIYAIPSAGIAGLGNTGVFVGGVAGQNLAASTVYTVFTFINSGTVTADFRAGASLHSTSSTAGNEGVEIRTGDDTRTLIGMIQTNASSQFADTTNLRCVISWFNRRSIPLVGTAIAGVTTASATLVELATSARAQFLTWAEEAIYVGVGGAVANNTVIDTQLDLGLDPPTLTPLISRRISGAPVNSTMATAMSGTGSVFLTEGSHIITPAGSAQSGTASYYVAANGLIRG